MGLVGPGLAQDLMEKEPRAPRDSPLHANARPLGKQNSKMSPGPSTAHRAGAQFAGRRLPLGPGGREPHSPLLCDSRPQLREQELPVEAIDGGDVGEDACGDLRGDPCFRQPGAENLGTQQSRGAVTTDGRAGASAAGMEEASSSRKTSRCVTGSSNLWS